VAPVNLTQRRLEGASRSISTQPAALSWCLPAPSAAATLGLRLGWLALLALALAWLVALCLDAEQGRSPLWAPVLGVLVVGAWALATRAWLIAALRVPAMGLHWQEATREQPASWVDNQGVRVKVDVLVDLGVGLLVQCRWLDEPSSGGSEVARASLHAPVLTRWVPAKAACLEVRWRLFHARHEAVASSSLPSNETQHVPKRHQGVMSTPSSSTTTRRKGQS